MPEHDTSWGYQPGQEIGYDQITASVTVASSTEASGTTIISCAEHAFDGGPVLVQFCAPFIQPPATAGGDFVVVCLFEGATQITRLNAVQNPTSPSQMAAPTTSTYRFTPSAGRHTYTVTAFWSGHSGGSVGCGVGGTGAYSPAFIRFTKV
jgi:hypothetical protein